MKDLLKDILIGLSIVILVWCIVETRQRKILKDIQEYITEQE